MKREHLEDALKLLAVLAICAPLLPAPRVGWWCAMRACQNVSRHFGLLGLAAEQKYRRCI